MKEKKLPGVVVLIVITYSKVEDEEVSGVSHILVEEDNKDDKKVADESQDNDEREKRRDKNWDNLHQDYEIFAVRDVCSWCLLPQSVVQPALVGGDY